MSNTNTETRTQDDITLESFQAFIDEICIRIDAERAIERPWWYAAHQLKPMTAAMEEASGMMFA